MWTIPAEFATSGEKCLSTVANQQAWSGGRLSGLLRLKPASGPMAVARVRRVIPACAGRPARSGLHLKAMMTSCTGNETKKGMSPKPFGVIAAVDCALVLAVTLLPKPLRIGPPPI
jgi:hypothetical protein